jgi:RNA polymerase sigma-70 factor (ECF subfamily)
VTEERQARFRELWDNQPRIAAYALRRAASPEDAADVVAETFAIAWQRLGDIPDGRDSLLWLYVTARNVLANDYRRRQRRSALIERIGDDMSRAMTCHGACDERGESARLLLASLPEADREILMLTGWEGLDAKDLGHVLGCSPVAARIRLHRARTRMAELSRDMEQASKQPVDIEHVQRQVISE